MLSAAAALLLPSLISGFWPTFRSNPLESAFPMEAKGDLRFQVDAARFLEQGAPAIDLSISVPQSALGDDVDSTSILITVQMLNRKGKPIAGFRREMTLPPSPQPSDEPFPVANQWLRLHPSWVEGTAGVQVRLEDLTRYKVGLWDQMHKKHLTGVAAGRLSEMPDGAGQPQWLSDLLFIWGQADSDSSSEPGGGLRALRSRLQPNPYRFYGLYQPVLSLYWERYPAPAGASLPPGSRLLETQRILRLADSLEVHAAAETVRVDTAARWTVKRLDVSALAAGSYRFEVSLQDLSSGGTGLLACSRGDFQVVRERSNWLLNESQLMAYGRVLLPAREYERFAELDRGGMETYLRDLWNRHAPSRPGEPNELEEKFLERVQHATENFRGHRSGIYSDRGRVYVRYGAPDEIRAELNPQDEELLWITLPQEVGDDGVDDPTLREHKAGWRSPYDNRAYEIWEYFGRGDPLLPEFANPSKRLGFKFIFVDEMGTGDYTLVYSSIPLL
jgi:GWxTD domain-containing protein